MKKTLYIVALSAALVGLTASGCGSRNEAFVNENAAYAQGQFRLLMQNLGEPNGTNYPRTINAEGKVLTTSMRDWVSGFFPGSLWYTYELTGKDEWREAAEKWTYSLEPLKSYTGTHDIGFMMYCSYGNAERLASKPEYRDILVETANSLLTRYNENTKTIKSWNGYRGWDGETLFQFPVIIDNMMNLELLFYASKVTGDDKYYRIAVEHANATMKNHFREDYSSYHVVGYDTETGAVVGKITSQGLSDNSTWGRGQAWAIYGFTMTYRETGDPAYLKTATGAADWFLANAPADLIPEWDFNAGMEGYVPDKNSRAVGYTGHEKDASAGAVICSALFELGEITSDKRYTEAAVKMLHTLASPAFRAPEGTNGGFLLEHSVGSIPHAREINVPLSYADYYFLEAMVRYRDMK